MSVPLLSIITPSYNRAEMIADAVESVLVQDDPAFEHIIVDGASTDGTLDVLARYPHLKVLSEPDQGMYDALNKGIRLARGEIVAWLNTDDFFTCGAFKLVRDAFERSLQALAVSGGVEYFRGNPAAPHVYQRFPPVVGHDFWPRMVDTPSTNAWFFHPQVFEQVGYFNTAYRYIADRELFIRIALSGIRPIACHETLYRYRQHEDSFTISAQDSRLPERGQQRIRVLTEDLAMLESFLCQRNLPRDGRRAIRQSHSERAYRLAATALYHRQFSQSFSAACRGWGNDILWPLVFIRMAIQRLTTGAARD